MTTKEIGIFIRKYKEYSKEDVLAFEKEWIKAVERLKKSNYNLQSIMIVQRVG